MPLEVFLWGEYQGKVVEGIEFEAWVGGKADSSHLKKVLLHFDPWINGLER